MSGSSLTFHWLLSCWTSGCASDIVAFSASLPRWSVRGVHLMFRLTFAAHLLVLVFISRLSAADRPNVLFIAVDDLNHWVGHLKRNPQTITPNLDRLASRGVSFSRAYCAAPACNPSRTALMSGMRPSTTGIYHNPNDYRPHIPPEQTLNVWFRNHGYRVTGAGKIYHGGFDRFEDWNDYQPKQAVRNQGAYSSSDHHGITWSVLKGDDDAVADYFTVSYCIEELQKTKREQPFFLACGIYRPHMPWSVPKKYFDLHPLADIQLPPHRDDDLNDIPEVGIRTAKPTGDHKAIVDAGAWKEAVQAYLAAISYADAQLGRLLDAFDKSSAKDNTIIVLWGDHGWHLGEKQHWRKFALWEEATRAPLIWVAPGVTARGQICERTVDFLSIYPTLCDLTGVPLPTHLDGRSIRILLANPQAEWDQPALTTHGHNRHAVRSERWRYIRYEDGSEELYDHDADPYEWDNLAGRTELADVKQQLAAAFPKVNHPEVPAGKSAPADKPKTRQKKQKQKPGKD
ncbi:MAG: sulfatase [Planctomycetaceae bacterium]